MHIRYVCLPIATQFPVISKRRVLYFDALGDIFYQAGSIRPELAIDPPPTSPVHDNFLKLHYIRNKMTHSVRWGVNM